ncbi:MAG TPA: hypothetical protein VFQ63_03390 [Patescibacteria group bacterium]|nr:hypothetical protein [Patescibacteria group bacterium]
MKKIVIMTSLMIGLILILSLVRISVSTMLTTGGISLSEVNTQIQSYQRENAILREEIYSLASLTSLSEKAEKDGFVESKTAALVISSGSNTVALGQ